MQKSNNKRHKACGMLCGIFGFAAAFLFAGTRAEAADAKPPLANLAEGVTDITGSGTVTNPEKLTDGDKYYLRYDNQGNSKSTSNAYDWEEYIEDGNGAEITGSDAWIQIDLGASYPIEVINVKHRNYVGQSTFRTGNTDGRATCKRLTGTKINYTKTAIVIGNQPDLSDGQVVFYQDGAPLPDGVEAPKEASTGSFQSAMGGEWYYMDYGNEKGKGPTQIGVTKDARYVRVYTTSGQSKVSFMELGVYGYREESQVQKPVEKRREINNENPLMIATAYSDDVFVRGQAETAGLQGWNTVAGRWNAIPDDLKEYNALMLHTNNLRQFAPDHIAQAYLQGFHEKGLQDAYAAGGAPIMLMCIGASSVQNGADWYITGCIDYGWLDLMFRMYPNMQGIFCSENGWSGYPSQVAAAASEMLEIADRFGGYFVWSELHNVFGYQPNTIKNMLAEHGDAFYVTYKNTEVAGTDLQDMSVYQGAWLAGYTGGWGMLSDTWSWDKRYSKLWEAQGSYSGWQRLCGEPETLLGIQMINTYLGGGCIYTFEFPEVVYGAKDTNSPANVHVISRLFRYFIENPAPGRKEILEQTKVMTYGNAAVYSGLNAPDTAGFNVYSTGRYGLIPALPTLESRADATAKLASAVKELGTEMPNVLSTSDPALASAAARQKHFQGLYGIEYVGDAFAKLLDGTWYVYNSQVNTDKSQAAVLPLKGHGDARMKTVIAPHTYFMMDENQDGTGLKIDLNNYRVDKDMWVFDNPQGWNWAGSFAPGQGILAGKLSAYNYMLEKNVVNAGENQLSPDDNEYKYGSDGNLTTTLSHNFRTTKFELTKLTEKPTVTVTKAQAADTDGAPQYKDPVVTYDSASGKAVISIEHNGWVELSVTDLHFAEDPDAIEIADGVKIDSGEGEPKVNLALNKTPSVSSSCSESNRLPHATDGNKDTGNYTDPGGNSGGAGWVEVDLGGLHKVEEVKMWRYYGSAREYHDTVIMLSPSPDFPADETLVLWNAYDNTQDISWPGNGNGQTGTHTLPKGADPDYGESSSGKSFKVYDSQVKWLDGSADREKPENMPGKDRFEARYVRVYMNGSKDNTSNHLVELEVYGEEGETEPVETLTDLTELGSLSVSSATSDGRLSHATDGNKDEPNYADPGGNDGGAQWLQVDLMGLHEVEEVKLWRYWRSSGRKYNDTVVLLSADADFAPDQTLVLWNAYDNTADITWPGGGNGTLSGGHQLPKGTDGDYTETEDGKSFKVYDSQVQWLDGSQDREKPQNVPGKKRFEARYVRVYMNGSNQGGSNHIVELEVNGIQGETVLVDTEPPTAPTGLKTRTVSVQNTIVDFNPSSDNYGVSHYEMRLEKSGTEIKAMEFSQTTLELGALEKGEYTLYVKAVDYAGNRSPEGSVAFVVKEDITVTASVPSGKYDEAQSVTLTASEAGGELYYTLNGKQPFDTSGNPASDAQHYEGPIRIEKSCILRAAVKKDGNVFPSVSWQYVIGKPEQGDFDAPDAPSEVKAQSRSAGAVSVEWSGTEVGITYYVYVNGEKQWEGEQMKCELTGLKPLTAYRIYVTAVDEEENESLRSETVEVITKK